MSIVNKTISETLAIKGAILPVSATTGTLYSNFAKADHTDRLQATLLVGSIVGTANIGVEQAWLNLNAVGITLTADAAGSDTTLAVSGGIFALNDWVSADGVNFVRVTTAKTTAAAGNLSVTALPAAVVSGAAVTALGNTSEIADLDSGLISGNYPFITQTPALASEAGVYTLDVRGADFNNNNPAPAGDGTGGGYNPAQYVRIKITLAVGSTSAVVAGELVDAVKAVPAYDFNAPGVVINQIQA